MKTSDFDYNLPVELIAQTAIEPRDSSRLLVLKRSTASIEHRNFKEIAGYFKSGDVLVMNNSRVIPARIFGRKANTNTAVEILLLRRSALGNTWEALAKPGKKLPVESIVEISSADGKQHIQAEIRNVLPDGVREVSFSDESQLPMLGNIPLPPYIHTPLDDSERYQTIYASDPGSVAAPTAGLHFTPRLLAEIKQKEIECLETTLHIGLDTFRPVQVEDPVEHHIHREYGIVSSEVACRVSKAKAEGRRIICVGTTSIRLLEYAAQQSPNNALEPFAGWVNLLILPGYRFRVADALITNFHLPRSTLLMLVSAFAGTGVIKQAYTEAVKENYRFYSFGDAMLIL